MKILHDGRYSISENGIVIGVYGKQVKAHILNTGYKVVRIAGKTYHLHRLLAEHFIPNPDKLPVVNHKDSNRLNNSLDNLEWASYAANNKQAYKHGNRSKAGENHHNNKLKDSDVLEILERLEQGDTAKSLAQVYGVSQSTVCNIKSKKRWQHLNI